MEVSIDFFINGKVFCTCVEVPKTLLQICVEMECFIFLSLNLQHRKCVKQLDMTCESNYENNFIKFYL